MSLVDRDFSHYHNITYQYAKLCRLIVYLNELLFGRVNVLPCLSVSVAHNFPDLVDCFTVEVFEDEIPDIEVVEGTSKNNRSYITCRLAQ